MKMTKKVIAVLAAISCVTAMSVTTAFADSEEFEGEEPERPTVSEDEGDSNVEDGDWEELGDSIFGDEDTSVTPAESTDSTESTATESVTSTDSAISNVTPVEVTPTTTVAATTTTPSTGNAGVAVAVGTALGSLAAIVAKRKAK
jgi:hypothetical protein